VLSSMVTFTGVAWELRNQKKTARNEKRGSMATLEVADFNCGVQHPKNEKKGRGARNQKERRARTCGVLTCFKIQLNVKVSWQPSTPVKPLGVLFNVRVPVKPQLKVLVLVLVEDVARRGGQVGCAESPLMDAKPGRSTRGPESLLFES